MTVEVKRHSGTMPRIRLVGGKTSSLARHINWFKYLESKKFDSDFRELFERPSKKQEVKKFGLEVIDRNIYAAYSPRVYERSYALRNSFSVTSDVDNNNPNIAAYFDLTKRGNPTAHNPSGSPEAKLLPGYAYAAFFESPVEFNSFLPVGTEPYRPFVGDIMQFMVDDMPQHAMDMYERTINKHKPS